MKTRSESDRRKNECPCCGQSGTRKFEDVGPKGPPLAYLLRQAFKRRPGKAKDRDWRIDPRPLDVVAILDRAYYERAKPGRHFVAPISRNVIRVSKDRVYYLRPLVDAWQGFLDLWPHRSAHQDSSRTRHLARFLDAGHQYCVRTLAKLRRG